MRLQLAMYYSQLQMPAESRAWLGVVGVIIVDKRVQNRLRCGMPFNVFENLLGVGDLNGRGPLHWRRVAQNALYCATLLAGVW